jgi:hypothetical protein
MEKFLTRTTRNTSYCVRCFFYDGQSKTHVRPSECSHGIRCYKCQRPVNNHPGSTALNCKFKLFNIKDGCKYCWIEKKSHSQPGTSGTTMCQFYNTDILKNICWLLWLENKQDTKNFITRNGVEVNTDEDFFNWIIRATRPGGQLLNGTHLAYEFAKDMHLI